MFVCKYAANNVVATDNIDRKFSAKDLDSFLELNP